MKLKALVWDVDGTLAETGRDGHRVAFNRAFVSCGLPWHWSEARYGELQAINSDRERLLRDMAGRPDAPRSASRRDALACRVRDMKIAIYPDLLRHAHLPLREGVMSLMQECRAQGVRMGIATTTSRACVEALLAFHLGPRWRRWFDALVCGEDVQRGNPDAEVYVRALLQARVCPSQAVAIEDSPLGAAAARAIDMAVVLAPSSGFVESSFPRVTAIGPDVLAVDAGLAGIRLADIDRWVAHERRPHD
jgi:HAD superfamily hydrolase (TIGR01509 family)